MYTFFYRHLAELNDTTRRRIARALTYFTRTVIFIIYVLALLIVISQRNTPTTQPTRQVAKHPRCPELELSIPDAETSSSTASCAV